MSLEVGAPVIESCSVKIDPQNVQFQFPTQFDLYLEADGTIILGTQEIYSGPDGARRYEQIRTAIETRKFLLTVFPDGRLRFEFLNNAPKK